MKAKGVTRETHFELTGVPVIVSLSWTHLWKYFPYFNAKHISSSRFKSWMTSDLH